MKICLKHGGDKIKQNEHIKIIAVTACFRVKHESTQDRA